MIRLSRSAAARSLAPIAALVTIAALAPSAAARPGREPAVVIRELPLPPAAPSTAAGACTASVNPRGTGCLDPGAEGVSSGPGSLPDGRFVLAGVTFAGAPAAPDPASAYSGQQTIVVRTDGRAFPGGDPWKCLTCGVPAANAVGLDADRSSYPQGFPDGKRVLIGGNVLDCSPYRVTDPRCTPARTHIYPIRWNVTADGSGAGGSIRELRINPDGVHLGWNHVVLTGTQYDEFAFMGRLVFDPSPTTGTPKAPRYDLTKVTELFNAAPQYQPYRVDPRDPHRLSYNPAGMIGEFRGWTGDGRSAIGIQLQESANIDAFATGNATGRSRPLTRHAQYTDPIRVSPDDRWALAMEVAGSGRLDFISAMQGIPPITDQLPTTGHISGIRNNGDRRFFLPYLVSTSTGRGTRLSYDGDPNWNGRADPTWLADGTGVVWWESLVTAPACGGANPLPCPPSTEPGGRRSRLLIARFPDRAPAPVRRVPPVPDTVAWGTPYTPGESLPVRPHLPAGTYTIKGKARGSAKVVITENAGRTAIASIQAAYTGYSDDGVHIINGTESVAGTGPAIAQTLTFHEDLWLSGRETGRKVTSEPGGFVLSPSSLQSDFQATGTMTTTIDGRTYRQPANGT
ncbi:hypothetical protein [Actinomadura sp. NTSP31]|uniref:hypothetical protein n=1 Tax=Actinomadura sp. NTSP31 TaxID=1735447 RepID=UPI0035C02B1E